MFERSGYRSISDIASELGCDCHTTWTLLRRYGEALLAADTDRSNGVTVLGLDETTERARGRVGPAVASRRVSVDTRENREFSRLSSRQNVTLDTYADRQQADQHMKHAAVVVVVVVGGAGDDGGAAPRPAPCDRRIADDLARPRTRRRRAGGRAMTGTRRVRGPADCTLVPMSFVFGWLGRHARGDESAGSVNTGVDESAVQKRGQVAGQPIEQLLTFGGRRAGRVAQHTVRADTDHPVGA